MTEHEHLRARAYANGRQRSIVTKPAGVAAEDAAARLAQALGIPGASPWLKPRDTRWLLDQWRLAEQAGRPLPDVGRLDPLTAPPLQRAQRAQPGRRAQPAHPLWAEALWTVIRICMVLYLLFAVVALLVAL